jgi:hypothetical protein
MLRRTLSMLARTTPMRWHLPNKLSRMQLIQYAIGQLSAHTYLEIGVDEGQAFCTVQAPVKIGVDPVTPRPPVAIEMRKAGVSYFQQPSDAFFAEQAARVLAPGVDVAFIDGLHTYGQTFRDIQNTLRYLNPGGIILVHDCLPESAAEARVAPTYEEAWRLNGPGWNGLWTGDGWKSIVAVRAGHAAGDACVLHCDHGVGLVCRQSSQPQLSLSLADIEALDYAALAASPERLLGLTKPRRLQSVLRTLRRERQPQ